MKSRHKNNNFAGKEVFVPNKILIIGVIAVAALLLFIFLSSILSHEKFMWMIICVLVGIIFWQILARTNAEEQVEILKADLNNANEKLKYYKEYVQRLEMGEYNKNE